MDLQGFIDQATAVGAGVVTAWGQAQVAAINAQSQPAPAPSGFMGGNMSGGNNSALLIIGGVALVGLLLVLKK